MRLWIRADASSSVGIGHVMRTIAVAERASRRGLEPLFVLGGGEVGARIVRERGMRARPGPTEAWIDETESGDVVVFDGYHLSAEEMQACCDRGCRVGAIDDLGAGSFPVDVLLNQNPLAEHAYLTPPGAVRLLGPRYALVREEFLPYRRDRSRDTPRVLLLTLGGSDAGGVTAPIVELLSQRTAFERVRVVVGPAAHVSGEVDKRSDVEVLRGPADIARCFATADAAIAAAGITTWELLTLGQPTALVRVVDNQSAVAPGVAMAGAALDLGGLDEYADRLLPAVEDLASSDVRRRLSHKALQMVDGRGADRFLSALLVDR